MRRLTRDAKRIALVCIFLLGAGSVPGPAVSLAWADSAPGEEGAVAVSSRSDTAAKAVDAALLRPLGALSLVVGAGFFVASLPITVASEQVGTAKEILVDGPYQSTFERPLGVL